MTEAKACVDFEFGNSSEYTWQEFVIEFEAI